MAGPTLARPIHSFRSWLFTPATKSDRFARAAEAGADALIIDLEDAVAPSAKEEARATALRYLAAIPAGQLPVLYESIRPIRDLALRTFRAYWVRPPNPITWSFRNATRLPSLAC
jgi:(S)-citramalyl-CoA lyase